MCVLWFIWQHYMECNLIFLILKLHKDEKKKGGKRKEFYNHTVYCIVSQTSGNGNIWHLPRRLVELQSYSLKPILWPSHLLWKKKKKNRYLQMQMKQPVLHNLLHIALLTQPTHQGSPLCQDPHRFLAEGQTIQKGIASQVPTVATSADSWITFRS